MRYIETALTWLVLLLWFFALTFTFLDSRERLRALKVDVALLQQQITVLLIGQGYHMQEEYRK